MNPLEGEAPASHMSRQTLGSLIHELSSLRARAVDSAMCRFGLNTPQWRILSALSRSNGASQSRIATQLGVAKGNLGAALSTLQQNGWVRRRTVPHDSRVRRVFLTQKAWSALSMVDETTLSLSHSMMQGLAADQQLKLIRALEKAQQNLAALANDDECPARAPASSNRATEELHAELEDSRGRSDSRMEQRLSVLTLGVADVPRSRRFYEQVLGWIASPASSEAVVFFELGGVTLALFERSLLAKDTGLPVGRGIGGFGGIALTHVVRSRQEVDAVLQRVASKQGRIIRAATDVFWGGYSGYFADPDGHPWEVASTSPLVQLRPDGRIQLPATEAFAAEGLSEGVS